MSFSGLKTAVMLERDACLEDGSIAATDVADIAASFQTAVSDVLVEKSRRALDDSGARAFAVAGGVAANTRIRGAIDTLCEELQVRFVKPPLALCTDNAAMIGWAGLELFATGHRDGFDLSARPRWPLDTRQAPMLGGGKKGAKA